MYVLSAATACIGTSLPLAHLFLNVCVTPKSNKLMDNRLATQPCVDDKVNEQH